MTAHRSAARLGGRALIALAAMVLSAGQAPAPAAPQAPPPAAPPVTPPVAAPQAAGARPAGPALAFTGDAGFVIFTVRAENAADFEAFFAKVKEALEQGAKPQYKEMAAGWRLFKVAEAAQSGQIFYASVMEPAVKGADYDPVKILFEVFPSDTATLYPKLKDALVGVNKLDLQMAFKMDGAGARLCPMPALPCATLPPPPGPAIQ